MSTAINSDLVFYFVWFVDCFYMFVCSFSSELLTHCGEVPVQFLNVNSLQPPKHHVDMYLIYTYILPLNKHIQWTP